MSQTAESRLTSQPLGIHLIVDLYGCACEGFDDVEWVENIMIEAANCAKAAIVDVVFHKFNPIGISGVVLIAKSHLAIHTWPEHRYAAIDIFTRGDVLDSEAAISYLATQFRCRKRSITKVLRGDADDLLVKAAVGGDAPYARRDTRVLATPPASNGYPSED